MEAVNEIKKEEADMASTSSDIVEIFSNIQETFTAELKIKESIRESVHDLEQAARVLLTHFSIIHQTPQRQIMEVLSSSTQLFDEVKGKLESLQQILPPNSYYRYHDHWRFVMQRLSFLTLLRMYLEQSTLSSDDTALKITTKTEVATFLGINSEAKNGFHLDLDDYLMGMLVLANELSRLAVNSVTLGDYQVPIQIASFVSMIISGFHMLNLKNDNLRRKYDALKYDMKRIEEIIYDLTIRGLVVKSEK